MVVLREWPESARDPFFLVFFANMNPTVKRKQHLEGKLFKLNLFCFLMHLRFCKKTSSICNGIRAAVWRLADCSWHMHRPNQTETLNEWSDMYDWLWCKSFSVQNIHMRIPYYFSDLMVELDSQGFEYAKYIYSNPINIWLAKNRPFAISSHPLWKEISRTNPVSNCNSNQSLLSCSLRNLTDFKIDSKVENVMNVAVLYSETFKLYSKTICPQLGANCIHSNFNGSDFFNNHILNAKSEDWGIF